MTQNICRQRFNYTAMQSTTSAINTTSWLWNRSKNFSACFPRAFHFISISADAFTQVRKRLPSNMWADVHWMNILGEDRCFTANQDLGAVHMWELFYWTYACRQQYWPELCHFELFWVVLLFVGAFSVCTFQRHWSIGPTRCSYLLNLITEIYIAYT